MFKNYKPSKYISYLLFILPIIFFFLIDMSRETDIWFLLSHGREVLTNGFPHTEFLTIHNGFSFIMQQWLSSVLFYIFYNYLGNICLYMFIFIVNIIILFFLYKLCMHITNNKIYASVLISVITDLLLELLFIIPRPQIFCILLLIIELYLLELFIKNKSNKSIYFLILLSILLINFQCSTWIMLFIFMGPYLVELLYLLIKNGDKRFYKLVLIFLICLVVGFINPYGIEAMTYFMRSYGVSYINKFIAEMKHVGFQDNITRTFSIFLIIYSIVIYFIIYKNRKRLTIRQVLFLLGTTFMAQLNLRSTSFYIISTLPFISNYINIKDGKDKIIPIKSYIVCGLIIIIVFSGAIINKNYIIKSDRDKIVEYLDKNSNKNIRLFTNFDDGPYYEFYNYKVYIDTRAEVFLKANNKKEDILLEYLNVTCGKSDTDKFLNKYNFDYLVVSKDDLLYFKLSNNESYELVYWYKDYYLFKRF